MTNPSPGITLTGADEHTPLPNLLRLADVGAEISILYTFSPDGRPRYPRRWWTAVALLELHGRAALHVCGGRARHQLMTGELDDLVAHASRVQINGMLAPAELWSFCRRWPLYPIITQHTDDNSALLAVPASNHAVLVDASGGRGQLPGWWQRPDTTKPVGFAGGLGPDTLAAELPRIATVARDPWWIDMEGNLRDESDRFSVPRALEVLALWNEWRARQ